MAYILAAVLLAQETEDRIYVEHVSVEFLKRFSDAERALDWKEMAELYALSLDKLRDKLMRPDPAAPRWIPLRHALADRLAALPSPFESSSLQAIERDPEAGIERYGYTRAAGDALDAIAARDFDEGRVTRAIRAWTRVLERWPTPERAARLARAFAMEGDAAAIARLRAPEGRIVVRGREVALADYLASLRVAPLLKPSPAEPSTNEILLGHHALQDEGGVYGMNPPSMLPACGRCGERDYVVLTNGLRVVALDPGRGDGGALENGVYWRYPSSDTPVREFMPTVFNTPVPFVGAAVEGGRCYATMLSRTPRARITGRRPDRFDGPAAIRAFDLITGRLLWDTDDLEIESLPFGSRNFSFGGPPIARGDRLYAAVMTSPTTERECFVLCLDAASGRPVWCRFVASAPRGSGPTSVAQIAEDRGMLLVQTSFGVAAALDAVTGAIEWAVKYEASGVRATVNAPFFQRNHAVLLTQDRTDLLALDRWSGRDVPVPQLPSELSWQDAQQFVGATEDSVVFSGTATFAFRLEDGRLIRLNREGDVSRGWRGAVAGSRLYLPTAASLDIYDTASWKLLSAHPWKDRFEGGHALVAEGLCLLLSDRLRIFSSESELRRRFAPRVDVNPPKAGDCAQLARILEADGRLSDAGVYYRRALEVYASDPAWSETAEELRKKLRALSDK